MTQPSSNQAVAHAAFDGFDRKSEFDGSVVMITGAAGGLGALLARRLCSQGARVALGDLDGKGVEQVAQELRALGGNVLARRCDVTVEDDLRHLVDAAQNAWGRLDIGVNNAGMSPALKEFIATTEHDLDTAMAVNMKGTFFGMKHQAALMLEQGSGTILNVSSAAGIAGAPKLAAYSAAKHAVIGLTKTAAVEYAKRGIRVNAVCPFFTSTPMVTHGHVAGLVDFLAASTPMKRLARPEEVVEVMLMLCSPRNSYMTGQAVAVDGGVSAL